MQLSVTQLVFDVVEPLGLGQLAGALEHRFGDVDADHAGGRCRPPRLARCLSRSAANVEHLVTGADPVGGAKMLVMGAQLDVVEIQPGRRGHRQTRTDSSGRGTRRTPDRPRRSNDSRSASAPLLKCAPTFEMQRHRR